MNRRNLLRVTGASVFATGLITGETAVSTAADTPAAEHGPGPDRTTGARRSALQASTQHPSETLVPNQQRNTTTTREQFVLSGALTGNYSADSGRLRIGLPGENTSAEILSNGSFAVDVPRDTFIDLAYVEEKEDGLITFNGNPDVYYIDSVEQLSADRDLGTIEIPEANVLDLQFEDASGTPLDGITAAVRSVNTDTDRWWEIAVSTDDDGFYRSENSPTGIEVYGDVQVAIVEDTDDPRVPDVDVVLDERLRVTEPRFESYTVDPITVTGTLVRPNDAPVTGGNVSVFTDQTDDAEVFTDQQGRFEIHVPERSRFVDGAYQIQYYRAGISNRSEEIAGGSWVELYAGPQLEGTIDEAVGTIQLPEGDLVTARVVDETGSPVEGAAIQYIDQNQVQGTTTGLYYPTDEAGVIDIEGRSGIRLSGSVRIVAYPPDEERFVDETVEESMMVDGTMTVDITLPSGDSLGPPGDPTERVLQIVGKDDPESVTQDDVTATLTRFNRGEPANGVEITQDDVTSLITVFERNV